MIDPEKQDLLSKDFLEQLGTAARIVAQKHKPFMEWVKKSPVLRGVAWVGFAASMYAQGIPSKDWPGIAARTLPVLFDEHMATAARELKEEIRKRQEGDEE